MSRARLRTTMALKIYDARKYLSKHAFRVVFKARPSAAGNERAVRGMRSRARDRRDFQLARRAEGGNYARR